VKDGNTVSTKTGKVLVIDMYPVQELLTVQDIVALPYDTPVTRPEPGSIVAILVG
jgi:hypothetical protein